MHFIGGDGLGLEIQNIVNIEKTSNFEIIMRLSTNIKSSDEFFTDLNGYQVILLGLCKLNFVNEVLNFRF